MLSVFPKEMQKNVTNKENKVINENCEVFANLKDNS